jgi:hypothetical protein
MMEERWQKMDEGQRALSSPPHHLSVPKMRLKPFVDGTRICSAHKNYMPIASANSGGTVKHYFRFNDHLTEQ